MMIPTFDAYVTVGTMHGSRWLIEAIICGVWSGKQSSQLEYNVDTQKERDDD